MSSSKRRRISRSPTDRGESSNAREKEIRDTIDMSDTEESKEKDPKEVIARAITKPDGSVGQLSVPEPLETYHKPPPLTFNYAERIENVPEAWNVELARCLICDPQRKLKPVKTGKVRGILKFNGSNIACIESHMQSAHPEEYGDYEILKDYSKSRKEDRRKEKIKKKEKTSDSQLGQMVFQKQDGKTQLKANPATVKQQAMFDEAVAVFAAKTKTSFKLLGSSEFQDLLNAKCKCRGVRVKHRTTIALNVVKVYQEVLDEILAVIQVLKGKNEIEGVAFTTDLWTDHGNNPYISLSLVIITR